MAATPTTVTTLTELVYAEAINDIIMDYAIDYTVAAPFVYWKDLRGMATKVGSFPRKVLDTASDTGETTDLTSVAFETTAVNITAAEIGLFRRLTYAAVEETTLGAALFDLLVDDSGRLAAVSLDDDIGALFASLSTSVGSSGTDLSIANMVQAQATVRKNKMKGRLVYVLDDQQASDLQAAQAAATSTTINGMMSPSITGGTESPYLGTFFGAEVWQTGLCDTANTGANVVGACFIRGDTNPASACFGGVVTRDVMVEFDKVIQSRQHLFVMSAKWGVGEIADESGCKIVTDA